MRRTGVVQYSIWIALGIGSFLFLKWRNDDLEVDARKLDPVVADSGVVLRLVDPLPKPFERLKSPLIIAAERAAKSAAERAASKPKVAPVRALPGETLSVSVTAYCLKGSTRTGSAVREGIVAADPRVFPLNSEIMLEVGGNPSELYRVEDTGLLIKGRTIDIWVSDCSEARTFGRKTGKATLAPQIRR